MSKHLWIIINLEVTFFHLYDVHIILVPWLLSQWISISLVQFEKNYLYSGVINFDVACTDTTVQYGKENFQIVKFKWVRKDINCQWRLEKVSKLTMQQDVSKAIPCGHEIIHLIYLTWSSCWVVAGQMFSLWYRYT